MEDEIILKMINEPRFLIWVVKKIVDYDIEGCEFLADMIAHPIEDFFDAIGNPPIDEVRQDVKNNPDFNWEDGYFRYTDAQQIESLTRDDYYGELIFYVYLIYELMVKIHEVDESVFKHVMGGKKWV